MIRLPGGEHRESEVESYLAAADDGTLKMHQPQQEMIRNQLAIQKAVWVISIVLLKRFSAT